MLNEVGRKNDPEQLRRSCVEKYEKIEIAKHIEAILGCLLQENWSTPVLIHMQINANNQIYGQCEGDSDHPTYLGSVDEIVTILLSVARKAGLGQYEIRYLLEKMSEIPRES